MQPTLTVRDETVGPDGPSPVPLLVWRFPEPRLCVSSAVLGGGTGTRHWVLNASVPISYSRTDPAHHLTEIATALGLDGVGVGLLTAVDVSNHHQAEDTGVAVTATVGLGSPAWAAAPDGHLRREGPTAGWRPAGPGRPVGTINVVAALPVHLTGAALVNAVVTATEAKAQALWEAGVEATGTASDAICVHCPADGAEIDYAGPRSDWGARLARAVHAAVLAGARQWLAGETAWRV
jgi:adenosylcobinamide amidohydrolase